MKYPSQQHFFHTAEVLKISATQLLSPCMMMDQASFPSQDKFRSYVAASPLHFYVRFYCSKSDVYHWKHRKLLAEVNKPLMVCDICFQEIQCTAEYMEEFGKKQRLRAFDPFSGTGAFAMAIQEAGALKLTHAIEISPSAAKTLRQVALFDFAHIVLIIT